MTHAAAVPRRIRLVRRPPQRRQVDADERARRREGRDHVARSRRRRAAPSAASCTAPDGQLDHRRHPGHAPPAHPARRAPQQRRAVDPRRRRRDRVLRAGRTRRSARATGSSTSSSTQFPRAKKVAIVTKIDAASKPAVAEQLLAVSELREWEAIIPVSATSRIQLDVLLDRAHRAAAGVASRSTRPTPSPTRRSRRASRELIREAALEGVSDELPHSLAVTIDDMIERDDKDLVEIYANLWVERDSQKGIIIGTGRSAAAGGRRARARRRSSRSSASRSSCRCGSRSRKDWQRDPKQLGPARVLIGAGRRGYIERMISAARSCAARRSARTVRWHVPPAHAELSWPSTSSRAGAVRARACLPFALARRRRLACVVAVRHRAPPSRSGGSSPGARARHRLGWPRSSRWRRCATRTRRTSRSSACSTRPRRYGGPLVRWLGLASALRRRARDRRLPRGRCRDRQADVGHTSVWPAASDLRVRCVARPCSSSSLDRRSCSPGPLGLLVRTPRCARRGRAARRGAVAEQEVAAEQERTRIARDMHDVVAHSLAVVVAQADGARYLGAEAIRRRPRRRSARSPRRRARRSPTCGCCSPSCATARPTARSRPSTTSTGSSSSCARVRPRRSRAETSGDPLPLGTAQQLAVYRIVQEALTNALRHGDIAHEAVRALRLDAARPRRSRSSSAARATSAPKAPYGPGHGIAGHDASARCSSAAGSRPARRRPVRRARVAARADRAARSRHARPRDGPRRERPHPRRPRRRSGPVPRRDPDAGRVPARPRVRGRGGRRRRGRRAGRRASQPDVVLMDIRMPVMDGIEATERILAARTRAAQPPARHRAHHLRPRRGGDPGDPRRSERVPAEGRRPGVPARRDPHRARRQRGASPPARDARAVRALRRARPRRRGARRSSRRSPRASARSSCSPRAG